MPCATRARADCRFRASSSMSDPLLPEPGIAKVPANVNVLRASVDRYAKASGLGIKRVQQRVFTELVVGLLDNAKSKGVIPLYVIKGGMALELRFGIRARASGDLDIALSGDDVLAQLDDALAVGFGNFTLSAARVRPISKMQRRIV
jgi:hypothetical protein